MFFANIQHEYRGTLRQRSFEGVQAPGRDAGGPRQPPPVTMWPAVLLAIAAFAGLLFFGGCKELPDISGLFPAVESATIKAENARIYITFDDASKGSLPRGQIAAIDSLDLRAWLDSKKVAWRIVPAVSTFADQPDWQAIDALPRASEPWLIVMGKATKPIVSQPLPADEASLRVILEKHLGK